MSKNKPKVFTSFEDLAELNYGPIGSPERTSYEEKKSKEQLERKRRFAEQKANHKKPFARPNTPTQPAK